MNADALAIEKGFMSLREVLARKGVDIDTFLPQLAAEWELRRKLGVLPLGQPGQVDPNAAASSSAKGDGQGAGGSGSKTDEVAPKANGE